MDDIEEFKTELRRYVDGEREFIARHKAEMEAMGARAEQAERERDEARMFWRGARDAKLAAILIMGSDESDNLKDCAQRTMDALARAEADNAALLRGIQEYHDAWKSGRDTLALAALLRLAKADHPGSALLERLRVLEVVVKEARDVAGLYKDGLVDGHMTASLDALVSAVSAADALKEKA